MNIQKAQTSGVKIPGVKALMYLLRSNEDTRVITGFPR
jgi:hypothetical protein